MTLSKLESVLYLVKIIFLNQLRGGGAQKKIIVENFQSKGGTENKIFKGQKKIIIFKAQIINLLFL